ncbi:NERD domain-containing protein/DEAD/DEAH box helicase [Lysobacter sp. Root559]|uniref:nuclease-related domain-containing DEAD/DEAH box helicase n=1 Tax=Lysobacter sp. Root559 TaxID=1736559 RepID=UPI0009EA5B53|nr:NERD domain-containing protein/DEAD/DEAH box helicase [Lysobacter sp. Root559]
MARMIPGLTEEQLREFRSKAEAKFYRACREQLANDVLVLHSIAWIYRDDHDRLREGEADFTIVSPRAGILVVEVKGGGVSYDAASGEWFSVDRFKKQHPIKDPFRQVSNERHAIKDQLAGSPLWRRWRGRRATLAHAVMLPDIHDARPLVSSERKIEFIGVDADMNDLSAWVSKAFRFWSSNDDDALGTQGVGLVEDILCSSVEVLPALRSYLDDSEKTRLRLTNNQARVLRTIGGRKRAVISGGAGTGKTLIAVEKSRQLASEGQQVLFLCYNRPLADAISSVNSSSQITVLSYHQLCDMRMASTFKLHGRDLRREAEEAYPGNSTKHMYDVQMPFALALSNEILDEKYDSLVIDEAQDFSDDYWFSLEELLRDPEHGSLYIFIDENQSIYRKHANLPVQDDPYHLTVNCRNTAEIHRAGYVYYSGEQVDEPDLSGQEIEHVAAETDVDQAASVVRLVGQLLGASVPPESIVVLLAKQPKSYLWELLQAHKLPGGVAWGIESPGRKSSVFVETVGRFKGLESQVVVLWLGDELVDGTHWETVYVGITRAKSLLYIVGSKRALSAIC